MQLVEQTFVFRYDARMIMLGYSVEIEEVGLRLLHQATMVHLAAGTST